MVETTLLRLLMSSSLSCLQIQQYQHIRLSLALHVSFLQMVVQAVPLTPSLRCILPLLIGNLIIIARRGFASVYTEYALVDGYM